jgi:hypothetical protein
MAKKQKDVKTINDLKSLIVNYIKLGYNEATIKHFCRGVVSSDFIADDALHELVEDVIADYPNFDLMQAIVSNKLVIDKDSRGDTVYIVDPLKGVITSVFKSRLSELFTKPDFASTTYTAEFIYNPYEFKILYKKGILWYFNEYQPSFWMHDYFYSGGDIPIKVVKELPEIYKDFLNHLVDNDQKSFNYILDWVANAIKKRNYTILTTIGNQGIGKGVLGDIIKMLVGDANFSLTDNKLVQKDFNAQLKNKRIIYLDEILIKTSSELNKFKSLINDTVEVEAKGVDAITTQNYASIYTSSNDMDAINLPGDDRRFSIVNLTDKKLKDNFNHKIEDLLIESNIEKLGQYLWHRDVDERKMLDVFISERTATIREATLNTWQDYMITEYVYKHAGKMIPLQDVCDDIKNDLDDFNFRIGRAALTKLCNKYPEKFSIIRPAAKPGKARKYYVKIPKDIK